MKCSYDGYYYKDTNPSCGFGAIVTENMFILIILLIIILIMIRKIISKMISKPAE